MASSPTVSPFSKERKTWRGLLAPQIIHRCSLLEYLLLILILETVPTYRKLKGVYVRIVIGITQDPKRIQTLLTANGGIKETLVEMGPFVSREEADNWLQFLESKIRMLKKIPPEQGHDEERLWYGFTFEQVTD